jgi:hypothetical protein
MTETLTKRGFTKLNETELRNLVNAKVAEAAQELQQRYQTTIQNLQTSLQNERERADNFEKLYKETHAIATMGRGNNGAKHEIRPEDLREFKAARLQSASLEEVIEFEAARKGLTVDQYIKRSLT